MAKRDQQIDIVAILSDQLGPASLLVVDESIPDQTTVRVWIDDANEASGQAAAAQFRDKTIALVQSQRLSLTATDIRCTAGDDRKFRHAFDAVINTTAAGVSGENRE